MVDTQTFYSRNPTGDEEEFDTPDADLDVFALMESGVIELPVRDWTERQFCGDCEDTTTFLCAEYPDGYVDGVCAFCGYSSSVARPDREED